MILRISSHARALAFGLAVALVTTPCDARRRNNMKVLFAALIFGPLIATALFLQSANAATTPGAMSRSTPIGPA